MISKVINTKNSNEDIDVSFYPYFSLMALI